MTLKITEDGVEPPTITAARGAFEERASQVTRNFTDECVRATEIGIAQIEAGDYVTLEALEREVGHE